MVDIGCCEFCDVIVTDVGGVVSILLDVADWCCEAFGKEVEDMYGGEVGVLGVTGEVFVCSIGFAR